AVQRRDVLPVVVPQPALRDEGHDPPGGPQPRLGAAVRLVRAGGRRHAGPLRDQPVGVLAAEGQAVTAVSRHAHWLAAALGAATLAAYAVAALPLRPAAGKPDLRAFAALPAVGDGRVKPLDTVA